MDKKPRARPKLTDVERHERFVETAREAEASEKGEDFDKAFERVTSGPTTAGTAANASKHAPAKP